MVVFLWSNGRFLAVFHQIWTSEGPNVVKILSARVSDPFPVTFPGGKFWYHEKKKLAHFWARREARFAICPFFYEKIVFRPGLFFGRLEQPKRPPNAPGLSSVPAAVPWQHYFHCCPLTMLLAWRSWGSLLQFSLDTSECCITASHACSEFLLNYLLAKRRSRT